MAKPKPHPKPATLPIDFETFVRAALQTGKPPKAKRTKRKGKRK